MYETLKGGKPESVSPQAPPQVLRGSGYHNRSPLINATNGAIRGNFHGYYVHAWATSVAVLLALLWGCSAPVSEHDGVDGGLGVTPAENLSPAELAAPTPPPDAAPADAVGYPCIASEDCPDGYTCEGMGCGDDMPGSCRSPDTPCSSDLRDYCSCTGETFYSSGTCPGQRYAHRGECEGNSP